MLPPRFLGMAFLASVLFSSCYKIENETAPEGFDIIAGIALDTVIPERQVLWGAIEGRKSEYHYSINRQNNLPYILPTRSYYYSEDKKLLSIRYNGTDNELFNLMDGSTEKVLSDFKNKVLQVANGRLYAMGPEVTNISYLKIYDIASNYTLLDSFQIRGNYLMVSKDGTMIYCQTNAGFGNYVSVLSFYNNEIKELVNLENKGIDLQDGVSMSNDGTKFVLYDGRVYDHLLDKKKDFNDDSDIYYMSANGERLMVKDRFENITVYKTSGQYYFGDEIFFHEIFDATIQKVIPFTKSDGVYLAISMFEANDGQQTVFYKVD